MSASKSCPSSYVSTWAVIFILHSWDQSYFVPLKYYVNYRNLSYWFCFSISKHYVNRFFPKVLFHIRSTHSSVFNARSLLYGRDKMVMGIAWWKSLLVRRDQSIAHHKRKRGYIGSISCLRRIRLFHDRAGREFANLNRLMEDIQKSHHAIKAQLIGRLR